MAVGLPPRQGFILGGLVTILVLYFSSRVANLTIDASKNPMVKNGCDLSIRWFAQEDSLVFTAFRRRKGKIDPQRMVKSLRHLVRPTEESHAHDDR